MYDTTNGHLPASQSGSIDLSFQQKYIKWQHESENKTEQFIKKKEKLFMGPYVLYNFDAIKKKLKTKPANLRNQ